MYEEILVPTDGSSGSAHIALQALDLAERYGASVHALNVVDSSLTSLLEDESTAAGELDERGERAVRIVEQMGEAHGVDVVTAVRSGDPAETILDYADEFSVDLIVAGTHGRSGLSRRLLGSVAERLVRHATCPVMTVRLPDTDVTVSDVDHARDLVDAALTDAGYEAEITSIERQLKVWVAEAESSGGTTVIAYLDPVSHRTSLFERD